MMNVWNKITVLKSIEKGEEIIILDPQGEYKQIEEQLNVNVERDKVIFND